MNLLFYFINDGEEVDHTLDYRNVNITSWRLSPVHFSFIHVFHHVENIQTSESFAALPPMLSCFEDFATRQVMSAYSTFGLVTRLVFPFVHVFTSFIIHDFPKILLIVIFLKLFL